MRKNTKLLSCTYKREHVWYTVHSSIIIMYHKGVTEYVKRRRLTVADDLCFLSVRIFDSQLYSLNCM